MGLLVKGLEFSLQLKERRVFPGYTKDTVSLFRAWLS